MKHIVLAFLMVSFLSGCSVFSKKEPEKVYVTETVYVKVTIPEYMREKCVVTKPIPIESYMDLNPIEREEYLTDYSISLLGNVRDCDKTRDKIIKLVDDTNTLHKDDVNERKSKH